MPTPNEDDDDVQQQDNGQQQEEQVSTGSKEWDKIIDDTAGTGAVAKDKQDDKAAQPGTRTDNTQQQDKGTKPAAREDEQQQQGERAAQRGQGNGEDTTVQPARSSARKFGDLFQSDTKGDIYDAQGQLIARQGAQRMIFHRLWPTLEANARELAGLRERHRNYEEANAVAKREGITLDEQGAAMQMFVQWKKDPIKMVSTLLTLAEQSGKDISSIRQSGGLTATDLRAAVQEIVGEAVKPFSFLTKQQEEQQQQQQLYDEVQTEYTAFIEDFPDARVHEGSIANVMRDKGLNHREAYFAVRAFAAERGLDWNKPLADQLLTKDGQTRQRNPSGAGNNRSQMPRIGGRGSSEAAHVEEGVNDQANANDSWDAIARRAMQKAGIQI